MCLTIGGTTTSTRHRAESDEQAELRKKQRTKIRIKGIRIRVALYPLTSHQALFNSFFLPKLPRPTKPDPKRSIVVGSGTGWTLVTRYMMSS